jgi:hypothetical protein
MTEGKIGALFKGSLQIGGFFNWRLDVDVQAVESGGYLDRRLQSWNCTAESYWLERVEQDVEARLYPDEGEWYYTSKVFIAYPASELNVLIPERISFSGHEPLEAVCIPSPKA